MEKRVVSTKKLVEVAVLTAIIVIMAFTPIGYIKTAGVEITLIVVPVAVGAVILGPVAGAVLGGVFGLTSFIQCFGMSLFGTMLFEVNPILTFLACVPTRILVGLLTGMVYKGLSNTRISNKIAVPIANLCCPLLNTFLFVFTVILFFTDTMKNSFGMTKIIPFFISFVGLNGLIEAGICFLIGVSLSAAVKAASPSRAV